MGSAVRSALHDDEVAIDLAETASKGLSAIVQSRPDLVLLDQYLPDAQWQSVLVRVSRIDARLPVVVMTSRTSPELATDTLRQGAFAFLSKPLQREKIVATTRRALECRSLMLMPVQLPSQVDSVIEWAERIIGRSKPMREVYSSIGKAAALDIPVLIEGEQGTGKELIARAIYQHGRRSDRPFVKLDCRDFAPEQLFVELFGNNDAHSMTEPTPGIGKIEQLPGGTLLLKNAETIPLAIQNHLADFIKFKKIPHHSGNVSVRAYTTLIFTSCENAEALLQDGRITQNLFDVLKSCRIPVPKLSERLEDLEELVRYFVSQFDKSRKLGRRNVVDVSHDVVSCLAGYTWPGNVRELREVIFYALDEGSEGVLTESNIDAALQVLGQRKSSTAVDHDEYSCDWKDFVEQRMVTGSCDIYNDCVMEMERHVLSIILHATHGNQAKAARILGITRTSLRKKIHYLGLQISSFVSNR